jgi:Uri superfamily endonuclease
MRNPVPFRNWQTGAPPRRPGCYVLWIDLETTFELACAVFRTLLPAGRYAYCGSARGSGGIAARIGRHCRPEKKNHWHIDYLLQVADVAETWWTTDEAWTECMAVMALKSQGGTFPMPGFGSSDCKKRCPAHLIQLDE